MLFLIFLVLDLSFKLDKEKLFKPLSTRIYDKNNAPLRYYTANDGIFRFKISYNEIPKPLLDTVLLFEDRYFFYHFGINPFAILRSFFHNLYSKNRFGASTISMQVARMMNRKKRTYFNKLIEIFISFQLEWHFTKREILEIYFNLAPYGGNIEGLKTAAFFYFNKPVKNLSLSQIAFLVSLPNRPNRLKTAVKNIPKILDLMLENKLINAQDYKRAKTENLQVARQKLPFFAPHFSDKIKNKNEKIQTSIDKQLQLDVERVLTKYVKRLNNMGVNNASAVVIDNATLKPIVYVGSHDFSLAQNDGVSMIRSAGSTLKPFIYALAIDAGLITAQTKLYDVPLSIKEYSPQNFYKNYFGKISAAEALQFSLNIPAVDLNNALGANSLYEFLKKASISSVDMSKKYYGHSIALGGLGISLLDITRLYSIFANKGVLIDKNISLISKEAAYLTAQILAQSGRANFNAYWESMKNKPIIATKTGTSADSKDLWVVGFDEKFSIGVWMGNFNSRPTSFLTGSKITNAVFDIFALIYANQNPKWLDKPSGVKTAAICADLISFDTCSEFITTELISTKPLVHSCAFLRPEVLAYLFKNGVKKDDLSLNSCFARLQKSPPIILSPYDGESITTSGNFAKVRLECHSFKDDIIFISVNDKPYQKALSGTDIFMDLKAGKYKISCLNSLSKEQIVHFTIKEQD